MKLIHRFNLKAGYEIVIFINPPILHTLYTCFQTVLSIQDKKMNLWLTYTI